MGIGLEMSSRNARYKYLRLSSVVEVDYPTPQVKLDLHGGTLGTYTGLDLLTCN